MELSIILINYNTRRLTKQTVASALQTVKKADFEIVVVDNSSDAQQVYESSDARVRVFAGVANRGFSHACNYGAARSRGAYLLFLNSDTILRERTVDEALSYLKEHEEVGVLGVRQLRPDGSLDHGCKRGFPTPMAAFCYFAGLDRLFPRSRRFGAYRQTFIHEEDVAQVDCVSGAFMLLSRAVFDGVGGFDEDYFMYSEDVDLCYRVRKQGYPIVYYGKVWFTHVKGQSGIDNPQVLWYFYQSMRIFYDKHYKKKYSALTGFLVHRAIDLKYWLAKRKLAKRGEEAS